MVKSGSKSPMLFVLPKYQPFKQNSLFNIICLLKNEKVVIIAPSKIYFIASKARSTDI